VVMHPKLLKLLRQAAGFLRKRFELKSS